MERVKLIEKNKNSPIHRYFTDGWTVGVKFMRFCFRSNCFSTQTQLKLTGFQSHLAPCQPKKHHDFWDFQHEKV